MKEPPHKTMILKNLRNPSIRRYLSLIFAIQIIAVVSVIAYLNYINTAEAIDNMAYHIQQEICENVCQTIKSTLEIPQAVVKNIVDVENSDFASFSDLDAWGSFFWHQIQKNPKLTGMGLATNNRDYITLLRSKQGGLVMKKCSAATGYDLLSYHADEKPSGKEQAFSKLPNYDGRKRPQYKTAAETGQPTWSKFAPHLTSASLFTTYSQPVLDTNGKLRAVVFGVLFADYFSDFLEEQKVGETGQIFVIDDSSNLIATSTGEKPMKIKGNSASNLHVSESRNHLTKAAFQELIDTGKSDKSVQYQTYFQYTGQKYFLSVLPLKDDYGLNWKIVVVVPEKDYTAAVNKNNRSTIIITFIFLLISLIVAVFTARRFTRPIEELCDSAAAIAEGDWKIPLETDREDEIGKLSNSFHSMGKQLQRLVEGLRISEQKFRSLAENVPGLVLSYKLNPDGSDELLYISKSVENIFEVSQEDALNNNKLLWDRIHRDDIGEYIESIKASSEKNSIWEQEHRLQFPDDRVKWLYIRGVPVRQDDGSVIWNTIAMDITDQKKNEFLLTKSQELGQIGTWELDLINNILTWTDENCRIFGVPEGSVVDYEIFLDKVHPDDREYVDREWKAAVEGKPYDIEHRLLLDGEVKWVREKADIAFDDNGKAVSAIGFTQDITDRKKTEEALEKSNSLLHATGRMARVGGWELDADTLEVTWTEETYRIHEVPCTHKPDLDEAINFFHPEDRDKLAQGLERALKQGTPYDMELRFKTAKGKELWTRTKCHPQVLNGRTEKLLGIFQDVTERKLAELAVLEAEEKFSTVFHASPAYIAFTTFEEGRFVLVNEAFSEITGYERREVLGKTTLEIGLWPHSKNRTRYIDQARQCGVFRDLEVTFKRKDGRQVVGLWSARKISLQDKAYLISVFVDITKRKQAELALDRRVKFERLIGRISSNFIELGVSESDANIEAALVSIGDFTGADRAYVFQFRADGDLMDNTHEWCAEGISPEIDHLQGIKLSEELPWLAKEIQRHPVIYVSDVNALPNEAALEREHFKVQHIQSLIVVPIRVEDQLIGLVGFDAVREHRVWSEEDQTVLRFAGEILANAIERKRKEAVLRKLEAQVQQSRKMESIGNLAGGIAHEFNNVLSIILGNAELALDDVPDWNPAKESLKEIRKASFRAKDVVRQILSFARKTMTALKPLEINTVVKESLKLMRASIPAMVDIQPKIPSARSMIMGDPTEIHQIVINLCTNAAHAMRENGGVLEVGISEVTLNGRDVSRYEDLSAGEFVRLSVKDSGEGIAVDILEKVFEPYFTTKEFGAGTGMGLAVVYGLVKKCKGAINIKSTVGKGTKVEVLFPKIEEETPAEEKIEGELPKGNERILLVDDDPSIVNMICQMLERFGYTVTSMTDSTTALERFRTARDDFDLVITDMSMPKMSGDQLAGELMKIRNDVPILLCTGHSDTFDEKKAKQIGIKGFAMKPLDMGKLARAVRAALDDR